MKERTDTVSNTFRTDDGAILYYEVYGTGKPILFVPGFAGYTRSFEKNIAGLSAKYQVVLYDPRGFGKSSKTNSGNTVERHTEDLRQLIEYLDLQDLCLVGWSSGCAVAINYGAVYSCDRLGSMGLIDPALYMFSGDDWNHEEDDIWANYQVELWYDAFFPWAENVQNYIKWYTSAVNPNANEETKALIEQGVRMLPYWIGIEFHYNCCSFDSVSILPKISVPTAFFSSVSAGYTVTKCEYFMSQISAMCKLYQFDGDGHMLFYNNPDKFNQDLMEFLNNL